MCRDDICSDSSPIELHESEAVSSESGTEKKEIPCSSNFTDPNDPALFAGKRS